MNEQQIKSLFKSVIDTGYPKLNKNEKEMFKTGIDQARNINELAAVVDSVIILSNSR